MIGAVYDFDPEEIEGAETWGEGKINTEEVNTLRFLSWNTGYCGLGQTTDFFYDTVPFV